MARKTLNQILKQNTFTGADVGKAILFNAVSFLKTGKYAIDDNSLDIMIGSLQTYSQRTVYQAYKSFATYLTTFYNMAEGNVQQFYHGMEHTLLLLSLARDNHNRYMDYIEQPLVITAADYNTYREKAEAEIYGAKYSLKDMKSLLIVAAIKTYQKKKELAPELAALKDILAKYEKEPATRTCYNSLATLKDKDVISIYAEAHNVNKDMETLSHFVLDKYNTDYNGEQILSETKIAAAKSEIYEALKEAKDSPHPTKQIERLLANLIREEVAHILIKMDRANKMLAYNSDGKGHTTLPIEKIEENRERLGHLFFDKFCQKAEIQTTKLEKLLTDLWPDVNDRAIERATELLGDTDAARKDFPEVFIAADELIAKLAPANKFSIKALAALGLDPEELLDLPAKIECTIADRYNKPTKKDLTCKAKAIKGGIAIAPKGKAAPRTPSWILNFNVLNLSARNDVFNKATTKKEQKTIEKDMVKIHIENLVIPALWSINGINALFDTYSNLLKVDLSPLKTDLSNIERRISAYNDLLYLLYDEIDNSLFTDTEKERAIIDQQKMDIKDTFPVINPEAYKLPPDKVKALEARLEALPVNEIISNKYFGQFLTGGGIIIE